MSCKATEEDERWGRTDSFSLGHKLFHKLTYPTNSFYPPGQKLLVGYVRFTPVIILAVEKTSSVKY